jgi:pimeloyl-ACP methyl ester carboxylesterase
MSQYQSSAPSTIVNLFLPYNLRIHDNPMLANTYKSPASQSISVYVKDQELEEALGADEAIISAAVDDLKTKLNHKLVVLEGKFSKSLPGFMTSLLDESGEKKSMRLHYTLNPVHPFDQCCKDISSSMSSIGINAEGFTDYLTDSVTPSADLVYSKSHFLYNLGSHIPKPVIRQQDDFHSRLSSVDASHHYFGESKALQLLKEYIELGDQAFSLKYYEQFIHSFATSSELQQSLHRLVSKPNTRINLKRESYFPGEVFSAMMSAYLAMGCISPRLLYWARSTMFPGLRGVGIERPLFCRLRDESIRRDWHLKLSMKAASPNLRFAHWKGYLQREYWSSHHDPSKPSLVLIHGFGGSINQYTGLIQELESSFNCYALDSLGFGQSEKPPLSYNQYLWRDQARDFVEKIYKSSQSQEIYLAGNSIGGFTAAAVAADLADSSDIRLAGLILINSAGQLYSPETYQANITSKLDDCYLYPTYSGPPSQVLQGIGKAIFSLLQPNIKRMCEWLYPTNPAYVSQGLTQAIYRDSCDMGASDVIAAGAKLPPPRPMNSLLEDYRGPVLIAQGVLDPLNDAKTRAYAYERIRPNISIDLLQLGHCPMDENPRLVATSIRSWMTKVKSSELDRSSVLMQV